MFPRRFNRVLEGLAARKAGSGGDGRLPPVPATALRDYITTFMAGITKTNRDYI
jgi:hypothetical protein